MGNGQRGCAGSHIRLFSAVWMDSRKLSGSRIRIIFVRRWDCAASIPFAPFVPDCHVRLAREEILAAMSDASAQKSHFTEQRATPFPNVRTAEIWP